MLRGKQRITDPTAGEMPAFWSRGGNGKRTEIQAGSKCSDYHQDRLSLCTEGRHLQVRFLSGSLFCIGD